MGEEQDCDDEVSGGTAFHVDFGKVVDITLSPVRVSIIVEEAWSSVRLLLGETTALTPCLPALSLELLIKRD